MRVKAMSQRPCRSTEVVRLIIAIENVDTRSVEKRPYFRYQFAARPKIEYLPWHIFKYERTMLPGCRLFFILNLDAGLRIATIRRAENDRARSAAWHL